METIGGKLRKAREAKGLALEDVYNQTKIHPKVLEALEQDKFSELSSSLYAKSFLKIYAQYLGLEIQELLKQYLEKEGLKESEQILVLGEKRLPSGYMGPHINQLKVVASCLAVAGLCLALALRSSSPHHAAKSSTESVKQKPRIELKREQTPITSGPQKMASVVKKILPAIKPKPLRLGIKAKEDCWIQVKSDDKVIFEDVLPRGTIEVWEAKERIDLWVGNGIAIELQLNGKPLGSPGRGVMKDIVITREGMRIKK